MFTNKNILAIESEKLCECGCGQSTSIAKQTNTKRGWIKDQPKRFISGHNSRARKLSDEHKRKIGLANSISLLGKKLPEKTRRRMRQSACRYWLNKKLSKEHCEKLCMSHKRFYKLHPNHQTGSRNPGWKGGISNLPYAIEFNAKLKKAIKKRDGNRCVICHETGGEGKNQYGTYLNRLDVHHKDADKNNTEMDNLITLCASCHSMIKGKNIFSLQLKEVV